MDSENSVIPQEPRKGSNRQPNSTSKAAGKRTTTTITTKPKSAEGRSS